MEGRRHPAATIGRPAAAHHRRKQVWPGGLSARGRPRPGPRGECDAAAQYCCASQAIGLAGDAFRRATGGKAPLSPVTDFRAGLGWPAFLGLITSGRCLQKATSQASLRLRWSLTHSPARDDQASREKFRDASRMCGIAGPWCAVPRSSTITLPGAQQKIVLGGNLGGKLALVKAIPGQFPPARASFTAGQAIYGVYRDRLVVHGKEKVYGSIP